MDNKGEQDIALTVDAAGAAKIVKTTKLGAPLNGGVKRRSKGTPDRRRRGTPFSDNMMLVC